MTNDDYYQVPGTWYSTDSLRITLFSADSFTVSQVRQQTSDVKLIPNDSEQIQSTMLAKLFDRIVWSSNQTTPVVDSL